MTSLAAISPNAYPGSPASAPTSEEADRLQRAREGDLAAFNALVVQHERAVFLLCRRFLGDDGAAEDVTQETFIAAWRTLGRVRSGSLRPWLLTVAANLCRSQLRRPVYRRSSSLERALENGMTEPQEAAGPEAAAVNGALRSSIERALARLPSEQRVAIQLRDVDGFDYLEIAAATHVSIGTVKSRIARARLRMRELLAPELAESGSSVS